MSNSILVSVIVLIVVAAVYLVSRNKRIKYVRTADVLKDVKEYIDFEMQKAFEVSKKVALPEVIKITEKANKRFPLAKVTHSLNRNVFMVDHRIQVIGTNQSIITSNFIDRYTNPNL